MVECILNKYKHRIYKSVLRGDKWYMILCFILSISMWIKSILSYYSIIQLVLRVFSCALLCVPVHVPVCQPSQCAWSARVLFVLTEIMLAELCCAVYCIF